MTALKTTVAVKETMPALSMSESELMEVLRTSVYPGAKEVSIKMAISYCRAAGYDVLQKPVHIVPMWDSKAGEMRDVIMPGIGSYRIQAARTGEYAGVSEPEFGEDVTETLTDVAITYPKWCKVIVKRALPNGIVAEFSAKELWKENYATAAKDKKTNITSTAPNAMWKKRPYAQLGKCAEAQALRKAFPEVGAQPTADEMEGKMLDESVTTIDNNTGEIVSSPKEPKKLPPYSEASFETNLPAWQKLVDSGKTPYDIVAMILTKFTLSDVQAKQIYALKKQEVELSAEANEFISAMESAEKEI